MAGWIVTAWLGVLTLAVVAVLARSARGSRRAERVELADLRSEVARLRAELEPAPVVASAVEPATAFVITRLGHEPEAPVLPPAQFADQVLRETVVTAASLVHGVRRALAPQTRDRIRGEMRREVKRSRKQRRADLRVARREWEARQRAGESAA